MSLIDRVKNILKEAPERTPDNPSGLDFEGQSKKFVKNERDKKKTMRKLEPKGSKQGELNLGNTNTTNTPLSTKRTLKGRPLGSKTKSKGETYKQLTTGGERQKQRKTIKKEFEKKIQPSYYDYQLFCFILLNFVYYRSRPTYLFHQIGLEISD